jgi:Recombination endonuclease VII
VSTAPAPLREAYGLLDPKGVQVGLVGPPLTPTRRFCPNTERPGWLLSKFHCPQDHALQQRYGITCDDYWGQYEAQEGRCGICRGKAGEGRLMVVDHDHDTGAVDGLTHFGCNRRLAQVFRRYLANPPGRSAGLVVPAAKLRRIEQLNKAKRTKKQATPQTSGAGNGSVSNLDRLRAMTKQGGS